MHATCVYPTRWQCGQERGHLLPSMAGNLVHTHNVQAAGLELENVAPGRFLSNSLWLSMQSDLLSGRLSPCQSPGERNSDV
jgi:hypothetical protein